MTYFRASIQQLAKDLQRAWSQDPLVLIEEEFTTDTSGVGANQLIVQEVEPDSLQQKGTPTSRTRVSRDASHE